MHIGSLFEDMKLRPCLLELVDGLLESYEMAADIMHANCDKALLDVCVARHLRGLPWHRRAEMVMPIYKLPLYLRYSII